MILLVILPSFFEPAACGQTIEKQSSLLVVVYPVVCLTKEERDTCLGPTLFWNPPRVMLRVNFPPFCWRTYYQGCIGAYYPGGKRGNGVPTPFSRLALKWVWSCFEMAIYWLRSHTFIVNTTSLVLSTHIIYSEVDRKQVAYSVFKELNSNCYV